MDIKEAIKLTLEGKTMINIIDGESYYLTWNDLMLMPRISREIIVGNAVEYGNFSNRINTGWNVYMKPEKLTAYEILIRAMELDNKCKWSMSIEDGGFLFTSADTKAPYNFNAFSVEGLNEKYNQNYELIEPDQ